MIFRPYPLLTAFTLCALVLLIWLGSWQLERRAWKAELIGAFERSANTQPVDLAAVMCAGAITPGLPVEGATVRPGDERVRVYGVGPGGAPGWRLFAPVSITACAPYPVILAEVGFEPLETALRGGDGRTVQASTPDALRFETPAPRGPFTPPNAPEADEFYAFDAAAMARALERSEGDVNPVWWLAADDGSLPAHLTQTPPERHVGYAVTWFLMAAALIAIYALFHVRAGRLALRP